MPEPTNFRRVGAVEPINSTTRQTAETGPPDSRKAALALNESAIARKLRGTVEALCKLDRRTMSLDGSAATHDFLFQRVKAAGLEVDNYPNKYDFPLEEALAEVEREIESWKEINEMVLEQNPEELEQRLEGVNFFVKATPIRNIRARIGDPNGRKIILGAHYDTDIFLQAGAGADDNASGVAVLLELASKMKAYEKAFKDAGICLEFAFFAAEEMPFGALGSQKYVNALKLDSGIDRVKMMINLDMLGFFKDEQELTLCPDYVFKGDERKRIKRLLEHRLPRFENYYLVTSDEAAEGKLGKRLTGDINKAGLVAREVGPKFLRISEADSDYFNFERGDSDEKSFWGFNFPVMRIGDNINRSPHFHRPTDLPETLNYERMAKLTQTLEKFLLEQGLKK